MAVVQISRIQIRRGQKNQNEGLPQLASGELAWAIDTQELFIGNGSLSEGAPFVGNSKVLTQSDDLFALANTYIYRQGTLQTGLNAASPISRSLQDRLDDTVSIRSFGATGTNEQDATPHIQLAINAFYMNAQTANEQGRMTIIFEPGVYKINNTIYLPPHTKIVGAGPERSIIEMVEDGFTGPMFKTINATGQDDTATTSGNAPHNIHIEGFTLKNKNDGVGIHLSSCNGSTFRNLDIVGPWIFGDAIQEANSTGLSTGVAILLDSLSPAVRTTHNTFESCTISGWSYGVVGNQEVTYNTWNNCVFDTLGEGVNFGSWLINNENPKYNKIKNSNFTNIHSRGINILAGTRNVSQNNKFVSVGNEGGTEYQAKHSIIHFLYFGNESINDNFSRTDWLATDNFFITDRPYHPEISGSIHYHDINPKEITIERVVDENSNLDFAPIIKLPAGQDQAYILHYYIFNGNDSFHRVGKLSIVCDISGELRSYVSDEYDHIGETDFIEGQNYLRDDVTFSTQIRNDGPADNSELVYSLYVMAKVGSNVFNNTKLRYTLETRRYSSL